MNEIIVRSSLRERLEALGGRRHQAWAVAGVVAVVVLGALFLWSRGGTTRVAPPATAPAASAAPPQAQATVAAPAGVVLVHVAGAVRRPGLYELDAGARVADAVRAAGGPLRRADLDALNLAESLVDGAKIEVSARGQTAAGSSALTAAPTATPSPGVAVIDLNTADAQQLETIPGVGPVTAAAILEYRSQIGSFTSVDQLLEVPGIGPVTLENMRPYVTT